MEARPTKRQRVSEVMGLLDDVKESIPEGAFLQSVNLLRDMHNEDQQYTLVYSKMSMDAGILPPTGMNGDTRVVINVREPIIKTRIVSMSDADAETMRSEIGKPVRPYSAVWNRLRRQQTLTDLAQGREIANDGGVSVTLMPFFTVLSITAL